MNQNQNNIQPQNESLNQESQAVPQFNMPQQDLSVPRFNDEQFRQTIRQLQAQPQLLNDNAAIVAPQVPMVVPIVNIQNPGVASYIPNNDLSQEQLLEQEELQLEVEEQKRRQQEPFETIEQQQSQSSSSSPSDTDTTAAEIGKEDAQALRLEQQKLDAKSTSNDDNKSASLKNDDLSSLKRDDRNNVNININLMHDATTTPPPTPRIKSDQRFTMNAGDTKADKNIGNTTLETTEPDLNSLSKPIIIKYNQQLDATLQTMPSQNERPPQIDDPSA